MLAATLIAASAVMLGCMSNDSTTGGRRLSGSTPWAVLDMSADQRIMTVGYKTYAGKGFTQQLDRLIVDETAETVTIGVYQTIGLPREPSAYAMLTLEEDVQLKQPLGDRRLIHEKLSPDFEGRRELVYRPIPEG